MRILRGLAGALLWILASVLGLVGIVLCVTIILLPLGIPLLGVARRLLTRAVQLMLPSALAHPVHELAKTTDKTGRRARSRASDAVAQDRKTIRGGRKRLSRLISR